MITHYGPTLKRLTTFSPLRKTDVDLTTLLGSEHPIEQNMVRYVGDDGSSRMPSSVLELYQNIDKTIIVERMEDYSFAFKRHGEELAKEIGWDGPITIHLFISPQDAKSFAFHTDVENVVIHCLSGRKTMDIKQTDGSVVEMIIEEGESLYIPQGVSHRATNRFEAMTLSYGFEYFIQDVIERRNNAQVGL